MWSYRLYCRYSLYKLFIVKKGLYYSPSRVLVTVSKRGFKIIVNMYNKLKNPVILYRRIYRLFEYCILTMRCAVTSYKGERVKACTLEDFVTRIKVRLN